MNSLTLKTYKNMKNNIRLYLALVCALFVTSCMQLETMLENGLDLTKVAVHNDKAYLMGEFNSQSYDKIKSVIDQNPEIKTIVLTINPGSLDDETTFKLARYIRRKKLNTHLINQSVIASGAVDLFLSGVNRTIEQGAKLGVHSWSDGVKQAKDYPRDHEVHDFNATYIKDMIGDDDFYWYTIYSAPADAVYWMKDEEIIQYKLLTQPFLAASNDMTPFADEFKAYRKSLLDEIPTSESF